MRPRRDVLALVTLVAAFASFDAAYGQNVPQAGDQANRDRALRAAQRAAELAHLRLKRFVNVEYPLKLRRLESEITLTKGEIASHERRIVEYQQFTKNAYSAPLFFSLEQARLALLEAELRLGDLKKERCLFIQHKTSQRRIYELELEEALSLITALEAG